MKKKNNIQRELEQKEFENDIERQLRTQELEQEFEQKFNKDYSPLELAGINFFGSLMIGYVLFYILKWFAGPIFGFLSSEIVRGIFAIFHVLIWGIAIIAVVMKKSPWDRFLK